ncbi:MAG: RNA polymerase sigma factor [Saprospiraceae bacterium]
MEVKAQNISLLVTACKNRNVDGQRKLYELFYSYGMSVCLRYTGNRDEAQEVLNDGFYRVFTKIDLYDQEQPFKSWFRVILIHAAIDYHRKYHKLDAFAELDSFDNLHPVQNDGLDNLLYEDVMECVQNLSPQYRLVFNLYAVDGLTHSEIAQRLDISVGTSKSNYSKARGKLQELLQNNNYLKFYKYGQKL